MKMKKSIRRFLFIIFGLILLPQLHAQTPSSIICVGDVINFREFNTGSGEPSIGWLWTFESGDPPVSVLREPPVKYNTPGLFKATCISIFGSGARDTNSAYILVLPKVMEPIPYVRDTIFCSPNVSIILDAGNNQPYNRFSWTSPDVTLLPGDTLSKLSINRPGTYKVQVSNVCATAEATAVIKRGEMPVVNLGPDLFVCRNIALTLSAGNNSTYQYLWTPTGEISSSIVAQTAGVYKVRVTSQDGCFAEDQVNLIDSCPPVYYIPNAFTPNDAPPNDVFKPIVEGFSSLKMRIYNRYGEKLFETNDLNEGWNGFANGAPAIEGVYICILELMGNDGFRRTDAGTFHLIR